MSIAAGTARAKIVSTRSTGLECHDHNDYSQNDSDQNNAYEDEHASKGAVIALAKTRRMLSSVLSTEKSQHNVGDEAAQSSGRSFNKHVADDSQLLRNKK